MVAWGMEQSIFNPRLTRDMLFRVRKELDFDSNLGCEWTSIGFGQV